MELDASYRRYQTIANRGSRHSRPFVAIVEYRSKTQRLHTVIGYYNTRQEAEEALRTVKNYSYEELREVCPLSPRLIRKAKTGAIYKKSDDDYRASRGLTENGRYKRIYLGRFKTKEDAEVMIKAVENLSIKELNEVRENLPTLDSHRKKQPQIISDYAKVIASNIRKYRLRAGMKQSELAKILGYKSISIIVSSIELGRTGMTLEKCVLFANALGISMSQLFETPDHKKNHPEEKLPVLNAEQQEEFKALSKMAKQFLNVKARKPAMKAQVMEKLLLAYYLKAKKKS